MPSAQPSIACLVSGQLIRFAYRHSGIECSGFASGCDVYTALALSNYTRYSTAAVLPYSGDADLLAGDSNADSERRLRERVARWLSPARGIQRVSVQLIAEARLASEMAMLDAAAELKDPALWAATSALRARVVHGNVVRWLHNGRMLWLRHRAFARAIDAERQRGSRYVIGELTHQNV